MVPAIAARLARAGPKPSNILNRQQFRKCDACAVDAAFDRASGTAADFSSLFVGEARGADEDWPLALARGQLAKRLLKLLEIDVAVLFGISLQRFSMAPVCCPLPRAGVCGTASSRR